MSTTPDTPTRTIDGSLGEQLKLLDSLVSNLREELAHAIAKHGPMASPHEGYSVILEEVDELWEHVKHDTGLSQAAIKEAMHIAAMGLRYAFDMARKGREADNLHAL